MSKKIKKSGFSKEDVISFIKRLFYENPKVVVKLRDIVTVTVKNMFSDRYVVKSVVAQLVDDGFLKEENGGFSFDAISDNSFEAKVVGSNRSSIFVSINPDEDDLMIRTENALCALYDDLVRVVLLPQSKKRRAEGVVTEIIERSKKKYSGVITLSGFGGFVEVDNKNMPYDIFIPQRLLEGAEDNDKVSIIIDEWKEGSGSPAGHVVKVFGKSGENSAEMHAILDEYCLPYEFPKKVEEAAEKIKEKFTAAEIKRRRDFRDITTFTIDPVDAKDFDDALSIRKLDSGLWEVGVHIADVTHYVKEDSVLDKEAVERATSVYLVDRVVPMLPERLSNGLCSLRPNEEKYTFSAVFEMDDKGKISSEWFGRTVINSDRRFTYEEAQQVIETGEGDFAQEVLKLDQLAKKMRKDRFSKGAIAFERDEPKFNLDENGKPLGVYFKVMKDSNHLVEEFMLLANRKVAEFVSKMKGKGGKKTFVYRIHDKPNAEKFNDFAKFVAKFGGVVNAPDDKSIGKEINRVLSEVKGKQESGILSILALRSMAKAKYSTQNIGHYGLAFPFYAHFTSPIRRYPDMMVHRLLAHYLAGGENANKDHYEDMSIHSSEREVLASEAERASIKYKMVEFLSDKIDQDFDGTISGVTEWGVYVELKETKIEGMVPVRTINDDFYNYDAENYRLVGERSHKSLNLGDNVVVKVVRADLRQKQIDFKLLSKIQMNAVVEERFDSGDNREERGSSRGARGDQRRKYNKKRGRKKDKGSRRNRE